MTEFVTGQTPAEMLVKYIAPKLIEPGVQPVTAEDMKFEYPETEFLGNVPEETRDVFGRTMRRDFIDRDGCALTGFIEMTIHDEFVGALSPNDAHKIPAASLGTMCHFISGEEMSIEIATDVWAMRDGRVFGGGWIDMKKDTAFTVEPDELDRMGLAKGIVNIFLPNLIVPEIEVTYEKSGKYAEYDGLWFAVYGQLYDGKTGPCLNNDREIGLPFVLKEFDRDDVAELTIGVEVVLASGTL